MHITLHLTNRCNMACDYCRTDSRKLLTMSAETVKKAVELAAHTLEGSAGIIFSGGEPLLEKELIAKTIEYCRSAGMRNSLFFHFKIITNGLLLDKGFMEFARDNGILVAMSHDGVNEAHDSHRRSCGGEGTFSTLSEKARLLLSYQPYAQAMMTVSPDTACYFADSVRYLHGTGFRYIISTLDLESAWEEPTFSILKEQYLELADFYIEKSLTESKFYFSPFEKRKSSDGGKYCREKYEPGKMRISVGPDGILYACDRLVGNSEYAIGNICDGMEAAGDDLFRAIRETMAGCGGCSISERCRHRSVCPESCAAGPEKDAASVAKAHAGILLPIAESLEKRLFSVRGSKSTQKKCDDECYQALPLGNDQKWGFKVYRNKKK